MVESCFIFSDLDLKKKSKFILEKLRKLHFMFSREITFYKINESIKQGEIVTVTLFLLKTVGMVIGCSLVAI